MSLYGNVRRPSIIEPSGVVLEALIQQACMRAIANKNIPEELIALICPIAKPFKEIQQMVAELMKDRVLVGWLAMLHTLG